MNEKELYKKHRPIKLTELVGQKEQIEILKGFIKRNEIPHAMLFTGPSGVGKTTAARIIQRKLQCSKFDYQEVNAATTGGIDLSRSISNTIHTFPLQGKTKIWTIDEAHQLTTPAQNALLKILEDTPSHAYIILVTSEPQKIIKAIHTRCTTIKFSPISNDDLETLIKDVAKKEKIKLSSEVIDKLIEVSGNSARKCLVVLDQIRDISSEEDMLNSMDKIDAQKAGIDLARCLFAPKINWSDVAKVINNLEEEPETVRRIILGYAQSICLKGGPLQKKAAIVLNAFRDHYYDVGKPGLTLSCYDVFSS